MTKGIKRKQKDTIIIILQALIPYRDQAEWFLEIIKTTDNKELEDKLIHTIHLYIKTIKSQKEIENIKKSATEIKNKYKYKEKKDKEDAEKLLNDFIDNI